ncbi:hypothetical protein [Micromonospora sp. CB01531]|uniref:hypothetical protein n=1 Tax=Micromonospora sp. CB01531 TaxID=1718947 RepID=UPI0009F81F82
MKGYENQIAASINAGNTVYYTATPNYIGENPIPISITMEAWTSSGASVVSVSILNIP